MTPRQPLERDGFLVANGEGIVLDVNAAGCELLGIPRSRIVGLSLVPHSPSELLPAIGARWSELRRAGVISGSTEIAGGDGVSRAVDYVAQADLPSPGSQLIRLRPEQLDAPARP